MRQTSDGLTGDRWRRSRLNRAGLLTRARRCRRSRGLLHARRYGLRCFRAHRGCSWWSGGLSTRLSRGGGRCWYRLRRSRQCHRNRLLWASGGPRSPWRRLPGLCTRWRCAGRPWRRYRRFRRYRRSGLLSAWLSRLLCRYGGGLAWFGYRRMSANLSAYRRLARLRRRCFRLRRGELGRYDGWRCLRRLDRHLPVCHRSRWRSWGRLRAACDLAGRV